MADWLKGVFFWFFKAMPGNPLLFYFGPCRPFLRKAHEKYHEMTEIRKIHISFWMNLCYA